MTVIKYVAKRKNLREKWRITLSDKIKKENMANILLTGEITIFSDYKRNNSYKRKKYL